MDDVFRAVKADRIYMQLKSIYNTFYRVIGFHSTVKVTFNAMMIDFAVFDHPTRAKFGGEREACSCGCRLPQPLCAATVC
jgi:hypothetical protein